MGKKIRTGISQISRLGDEWTGTPFRNTCIKSLGTSDLAFLV